MTINSYQIRGDDCGDVCSFPALKELLPDYFAGQLGATAAEAMEDHLLACRTCREGYLEYLKLLGSAFAAFSKYAARGGAVAPDAERTTAPDTKVVWLEEFKRYRP